MSIHLPSRRALQAAATAGLRPSASTTRYALIQPVAAAITPAKAAPSSRPFIQRRNLFGWGGKKETDDLAFAKTVRGDAERLQKKLASTNINDSIFADELGDEPSEDDKGAGASQSKLRSGGSRSYEAMARSTDPDPRSRVRWQRKVVARMVARRLDPRDRETREERIARTERQYVSRGPLLHTSSKKLVHLARQVAGKTVEEAMIQMRFSKKKWARQIGHQLDLARDEATVVAGMGLGSAPDPEASAASKFDEIKLQTKDGKWLKIDDPTRVYVEQAWVNRGPFHFVRPNYRAKGRTHKMVDKTANITLVVKEEKTRIREHEERKAKRARQAPWVHLPNRPITSQRQHYSW